jgi:hypothetical protein
LTLKLFHERAVLGLE